MANKKQILIIFFAVIILAGFGFTKEASAETLTLVPNAAGDYNNIPSPTPTNEHWDKVDDPPGSPDDSSTRIWLGAGTAYDVYNLENTDQTGTINSVRVYFRTRANSTSNQARPRLRLGTEETTGTAVYQTTSWVTRSEVLARPGGGNWSWEDINNLQVGIGIICYYANEGSVTQVYIEVDYTPYLVTLVPDGTGDYINLSRSGDDANWKCVDDSPGSHDEDSTYVYSVTYGTYTKDVYALQDTSQIGTIESVRVYFRFRNISATWAECYPLLRLSANETSGTVRSVIDYTWTTFDEILSRPGGGSWSWADINNLQVGVGMRRPTGVGYQAQCTQVYIEVDYTPAAPNQAPTADSVTDDGSVTVGDNITFTGNWSEPNPGDNVKMYICQDSGCTNCDNTSQTNCWCYSSAWNTEPDTSDACSYTTSVVGNHDYWLGVCDDEPSCDPTPLSGGTFTVEAAEPIWPGDWSYQMELTIDSSKIDSDLIDFPVLVKLDSTNFDFSQAYSNGHDIRFVTSTDGEFLAYERERHDSGSQKAEYWVKIPFVSSSADTKFYIYYGAPAGVPDGENPTAVWDSNFKMVQHLQETSGIHYDSTSYGNNGSSIADIEDADMEKSDVGDWPVIPSSVPSTREKSTSVIYEGSRSLHIAGNAYTGARQLVNVISGKQYQLTAAMYLTSGTMYIRVGKGSDEAIVAQIKHLDTDSTWYFKSTTFIAPESSIYIYPRCHDQACDFYADDITLTCLDCTPTQNATGKIDGADEFDGSDDYINCGSGATLDDITIKTIELWTYLHARSPSQNSVGSHWINKGDAAWFLATDEGNTRNIFGHNFTSTQGRWSFAEFSLNVWHHITLIYDKSSPANDPTIYVDAVSQTVTEYAAPSGTAASDAANDLLISKSPNYDRWVDGLIDEIRISNTPRSPAWIKASYYSGNNSLLGYGSEETPGVPEVTYSRTATAIYEVLNSPPEARNLSVDSTGRCFTGYASVYLSWEFYDLDLASGDYQSAYQVQVDDEDSFSPPLINDSGKVNTPGYEYSPNNLSFNATYYWRVRVWDDQEAVSDYTDGGSFNTELKYPWPDFDWTPETPSVGGAVQFCSVYEEDICPENKSTCYDINTNPISCFGGIFTWTIPGDYEFLDETNSNSENPRVKFLTIIEGVVTLEVTDTYNHGPCSETHPLKVTLPLPEWKEIAPY